MKGLLQQRTGRLLPPPPLLCVLLFECAPFRLRLPWCKHTPAAAPPLWCIHCHLDWLQPCEQHSARFHDQFVICLSVCNGLANTATQTWLCRHRTEKSLGANLLVTADEVGNISIWQAVTSREYKVPSLAG